MSRRRQADKRPQLPDAKFGDFVIAKFISTVMMHGKKGVAETIVYGALEKISKKAVLFIGAGRWPLTPACLCWWRCAALHCRL